MSTPIFDSLAPDELPPVLATPATELPETLKILNTTEAEVARELAVSTLRLAANNASDPYDGHHGDDRSEESIDYALQNNPALLKKLQQRLSEVEGS